MIHDEQAATDEYEDICGGRHNAERLFKLYCNSYASNGYYAKTKEEIFEDRAIREGFTKKQINALYRLQ